MAIKTILIPVNGTEASRPAMEMAFTLGRDLAAHVTVLHVSADARDALPLMGEGLSGAMIEELLDLAEHEIVERRDGAQAMFEAFCERFQIPVVETPREPDAGASTHWLREKGAEDARVANRGRLADLIVLATPAGQDEAMRRMTLNAALFETGRPVLVAPASVPATIGQHVAIAWNGSAEAARAVSAALPLMERAEKITVLGVETQKTPGTAAGDLAGFLAWHGIEAEAFTLASAPDRSVGELLLTHCTEAGADMLVMGAYTHSRMRELIMGGVTRHVLGGAAVPVLMAH